MGYKHKAVELGGGLNFKIVGGTTQPASPKENTIWIKTDVAIGEYQFSATEPTIRADGTALQSGDVWIKVDMLSTSKMNVLKKNAVYVYPMLANQYINGEWQAKTALSYQNGQWNEWWTDVLNAMGVFTTVRENGTGNFTVNKNTGVIVATTTGQYSTLQGHVSHFSDIQYDLSKYKTLSFDIDLSGKSVYCNVGFYSVNNSPYSFQNKIAIKTFSSEAIGTFTVDLSAVTSKGYFAVGMSGYTDTNGGDTTTAIISNIKLQ